MVEVRQFFMELAKQLCIFFVLFNIEKTRQILHLFLSFLMNLGENTIDLFQIFVLYLLLFSNGF